MNSYNIILYVNPLTLMNYYNINKEGWDKSLEKLLLSYQIFASISNEFSQDYELLTSKNIGDITYNKPKPVTPLKNFFLPVKENVTSERKDEKPRIILGTPNCDIEALRILDEIYLDENFDDVFYRQRRENTITIASDCFSLQEHCHCLSYNVKPYPTNNADLAIILNNGIIFLRVISEKGESLLKLIEGATPISDNSSVAFIDSQHKKTETKLRDSNTGLPDYQKTGSLIKESDEDIWEKYSSNCVSCGACTTICPTCSCFLLIEKPGFHKVKQMDACQYPGFERVAGGEDGLHEISVRFRNRYMCKYLWKPRKFKSPACTGCGRCIEACIGKINKNELFTELAK
jgi:sulfhydrogenase subunit beta (sulfur reductase)